MYKNIYQVAEKPISEEDYITSDSFLNHSFIGKVADCVKIAANRNYEIEMLAEWLESNRLGKIKGKLLTPLMKENLWIFLLSQTCFLRRTGSSIIHMGFISIRIRKNC